MKRQHGFTIVELLIVIIVIGILATLILVAYRGVTDQAKSSAAKNDLEHIAKQLNVYKENTGGGTTYPADTSSLQYSSGTTIQYSVNNAVNPATYCVTATNGSVSYFVSNGSQAPAAGGCPGHGINGVAPITNLITNPSFETGTSGWSAINSAVIAQTTEQKYSGAYSVKVTPSTSSTYSGINIAPPGNTGTQYTFSAYVYSVSSQSINFAADGYGVNTGMTIGPAWQRLTVTGTKTSTNPLFIRAVGTAGIVFYVDAIMVTQGATTYNYADGSSSNWVWNGTANNATSTGPVL